MDCDPKQRVPKQSLKLKQSMLKRSRYLEDVILQRRDTYNTSTDTRGVLYTKVQYENCDSEINTQRISDWSRLQTDPVDTDPVDTLLREEKEARRVTKREKRSMLSH